MPEPVLTQRGLNRALLARQLLLDRATQSVVDAVDHLVGLQAQLPANPYTGLWSRLADLDPEAVGDLLEDRSLVRIAVMRSTIHLVSADDALRLRPVVQEVLDRELSGGPHRAVIAEADAGGAAAHVVAAVRDLVEETPRTAAEIRAAVAERFPDVDAAALAYACRNRLALVQVPPRGRWRRSGPVRSTTVQHWLGRPLASDTIVDDLVLRYLAAFGPATVADVSAWSRLQGQRAVIDRLRPQLRTFRNEAGQELLDVPDGLLPDPDTPAPVRILPEYDNALLSHADRARCFLTEEIRRAVWGTAGRNGTVHGTVTHDGFVVATWRFARAAGEPVTLVVSPATSLAARARRAIEREATAFLAFHEPPGTATDVHIRPFG